MDLTRVVVGVYGKDMGNNRSSGDLGIDRRGRRVCSHCIHRNGNHKSARVRGSIQSLPGVPQGQYHADKYIPLFAWLDPGEDRALLHVLIRGPRGGTHYISLWLDDLASILNTRTEGPVTFTLSPDVRLLEVLGRDILRHGFPPSWLNALERGYVKPGKDLKREYKSILSKVL